MKSLVFAIAMLAVLACGACSTIDISCPCGAGTATASSGGPTALVNALIPLLGLAAKGGLGLPLVMAQTPAGAPGAPAMCGTIHTTTFDLLGTTNVSCSSLLK